MNRIAETDSETRLDFASGRADSVLGRTVMVLVHLHRIDTNINMSRFYCIDLAATLFGEVTVLRRWGRIGTCGRTSLETWPRAGEAEASANRTLRQKSRRGYRPAEPSLNLGNNA